MTRLDQHRPPTRAARDRSADAARPDRRPDSTDRHPHNADRRPDHADRRPDLADRQGRPSTRGPRRRAERRRARRAHSAVGAAVVGVAAVAVVVGLILTSGTGGRDTGTVTPPSSRDGISVNGNPAPDADAAPSISTTRADRKPSLTPSSPNTGRQSPRDQAGPPNTGPESPKFRPGQWIAVLDSYPTDAGMAADQVAKNLAARLIAAGVPAKAMLAGGQYPGLAAGDLRPITNTWVVYLGPFASSEAANAVCVAPKTQKVHSNIACPTYEPATPVG